jgi:hypothetical protein
MKRLSWKYLAGLIDGEGCIDMQIGKRQVDGQEIFYCRPRLRMTLSGPAGPLVLSILSANFGGHFDKTRIENERWLPAYTWALTGKTHLRSVLQNLVNHLIIKKEQAKFAIHWIDLVGGKHVSQEARHFAHDELKAMKKDPQRLSEKAVENLNLLMR